MKTVEIHLGYFKQGDDLHSCVEDVGNRVLAINALANRLETVVEHLDEIYEIVRDKEIEIEADTHYIGITCEDEVAQELVDAGLAYFPEYEE